MASSSILLNINRRRFVQLLGSGAVLLNLPGRWMAGESQSKLKALVLERTGLPGLGSWGTTGWVSELTGAERMLKLANFDVSPIDLDQDFIHQKADLLVLGSYISCHDDVMQYLESNGPAIKDFVHDGGVVLQLVEAPLYDQFIHSERPQKESSELILSSSLSVKRTRETFWELHVKDISHPLLAGFQMDPEKPMLNFSELFNDTASWMAIGAHHGFRVLISHNEDDSRTALLEGSYGKGRYIISSLFFDKLFNANNEAVKSPFVEASERFYLNLHNYTEQVTNHTAPAVISGSGYQEPPPADVPEGAFTLVVIPDTQMYCFHEEWNVHFHNITQWIVDEKELLNIQYVIHVGDLVHRGGQEPMQWPIARDAMRRLDNHVPYAITTGNHDYSDGRSQSRESLINEYFPPDYYKSMPTFGECMDSNKIENSYHTFVAHDTSFLILNLEFWPRDHVIEWANQIIEMHPGNRILLNTHAYMYTDSKRYNLRDCGVRQMWNPTAYNSEGGGNDGQEMWEKLVSRHPNFIMTVNGHVLNDGLGRKTSIGQHGNFVHQMLVNYQSYYEGGEGLVRLLHFHPDKKTVQVRTISTSTGQFRTGPQEQFKLELSDLVKKT